MPDSDPTQLPDGVPEDAVDSLYGLPLEEFTPQRDALAKELRGDGERDAAAWVKGLKKPSATAWVVNQLARTQKKDAKRVLDSGEALRAAQDRTLAGKADAGELAEASSEHAEAMRALLTKAPGVLDGKGNGPSNATLERAAETLRAIPLDDQAREGFASGRLTRERQAAGLGFMPGAEVAARPPSRPAKKSKAAEKKPAEKPKPDRKEKARAKTAVDQAKAAHRSRRDEAADLERDVRQAQRALDRAQTAFDKATVAFERAKAKETDAEERLDDAEAEFRRLK